MCSDYIGAGQEDCKYMPMTRFLDHVENVTKDEASTQGKSRLDSVSVNNTAAYVPIKLSRGRQTSTGNESIGPTSSEPESVEGQDSYEEEASSPKNIQREFQVINSDILDLKEAENGASMSYRYVNNNRLHMVRSLPIIGSLENQ